MAIIDVFKPMNPKIAVSVGLAAILASMFALPQAALAADVNVSITVGASTKTTDAFSPNPVEINVGDTVIWTNDDSTPHTATSGTSPTPDGLFGGNAETGGTILVKGKTESHTFTEAGEFPYFCTLHPTMVGTVKVGGGMTTGEFTTTASIGGNDYEITGKSATVKATAATIDAGKAVSITFDKAGDVELILPKTMIDGITVVMAGSQNVTFTKTTETADSTTITFTIPEGSTTVDIMGTTVIPEFPVVAAVILGASIAAIIGYTRYSKGGITNLFRRD